MVERCRRLHGWAAAGACRGATASAAANAAHAAHGSGSTQGGSKGTFQCYARRQSMSNEEHSTPYSHSAAPTLRLECTFLPNQLA